MSPEQEDKQLRSLADILGRSQPAGLGDLAPGDPMKTSVLQSILDSLSTSAPPVAPPVIRDRWFKGQTIHIDGYTFERCRFDACTLVVGMATFILRQCYVDPTCRLYFSGPSLKLARLMLHMMRIQGRIQMLPGEEGVFAQLGGADGTFTVE